jgi:hypothetical protein
MHQVIDDVDPVERGDQRIEIAQVAPYQLGPVPPRYAGQLVRVAGHRPHPITAV